MKSTDFGRSGAVERTPRLGDNLVRVQRQKSNGQYKITIPRGLARSLRLSGGEVLEVFIERGDLVLRLMGENGK